VVISAALVFREYVCASEMLNKSQDIHTYFDHSQPLDSNPREGGMLSLSHVFSFACTIHSHHLSHVNLQMKTRSTAVIVA
jgi:hypothetical protein